MENKAPKFLSDENIPKKLKSIFETNNYIVDTVQELGWSGIKNGELSKQTKYKNYILVTRDRDFIYLWEKYSIQVIYLAIHLPVIENLSPRLEELLANWVFEVEPFLIIFQEDSIRSWKT